MTAENDEYWVVEGRKLEYDDRCYVDALDLTVSGKFK